MSSPSQQTSKEASQQDRANKIVNIIIISDEIELIERLQIELSQVGHLVNVIHDGLRGLLAVNRMKPEIVIVSWLPPRLSALELCQRLRASGRHADVIVITQEDSAQQRIDGFNAGATECLSLPLHREEFLVRVDALINSRSQLPTKNSLLRFEDLMLNCETREVFKGDRHISFTAKEFDLLEYLMRHPEQVLTRFQILENVWGYDYTGNSNIIEVYIRYLRRKLGSTPENRLIHTVRSVGYILKSNNYERN